VSEPVFLTQERLAQRWGVTTRTIARKRALGLIPAPEVYFGLHPAWGLEAVAAMEEEMRRRAAESPPKFSSTQPAIEANAQKCAKLAARATKAAPKRMPRRGKAP